MTSTDANATIPAHHQGDVEAITDALAQEFSPAIPRSTAAEFVRASYETYASRAAEDATLLSQTEGFARQRIQALLASQDEASDAPPAVLFLCIHNAGRSQMALGFLKHHAKGRVVAWSGGSNPGNAVNPAAVEAMNEKGIDITGEFPKPWTDEIVRAADVVVTMGCGDTCPFYPGTRYEDWELEDPAGQGVDAVRPIRDEVERRVLELLASLGVETDGPVA